MKAFFDRIDSWPSDSFGPVTFTSMNFNEMCAVSILIVTVFLLILSVLGGIEQMVRRRRGRKVK